MSLTAPVTSTPISSSQARLLPVPSEPVQEALPKGRRVPVASLCKIFPCLHPAKVLSHLDLPHLPPSSGPVSLPSPTGYWLDLDTRATLLVLLQILASSVPATWSSFSPSAKLVWTACCESGLVANMERQTQPLTSENSHPLERWPPLLRRLLTRETLTSQGWTQVHLPPGGTPATTSFPPSLCPVKSCPCHLCVPNRLNPIVSFSFRPQFLAQSTWHTL